MTWQNTEDLARELEKNNSYRVLRRLDHRTVYNTTATDENKLVGVFVDVETTGLSEERDKIIELGLVSFEFLPDGRIFNILGEYDGFEDPEIPLSEEIISLTGITDEMIKGKSLDQSAINEIIDPSAVIIAHNANFDRKFLEKRFPFFANKAWACSLNDVPWAAEGIESSKLEYIAYKQGFFFEGHRAINDCFAGIHVLSLPLPVSNEPTLKKLLDNAREKEYRIWAEHSPFEAKDILKTRGYRWCNGDHGKPKSWYLDVSGENLKSELKFLREEIYSSEVELKVDIITAFNRYSNRA